MLASYNCYQTKRFFFYHRHLGKRLFTYITSIDLEYSVFYFEIQYELTGIRYLRNRVILKPQFWAVLYRTRINDID